MHKYDLSIDAVCEAFYERDFDLFCCLIDEYNESDRSFFVDLATYTKVSEYEKVEMFVSVCKRKS